MFKPAFLQIKIHLNFEHTTPSHEKKEDLKKCNINYIEFNVQKI